MRYEIGFGVGFDEAGKPIDPQHVRECIKLIMVEACNRFGGCNITSGQGAWLDSSGTLIVEESRVLVVDSLAGRFATQGEWDTQAKDLAEFVRRVLNQAAVHVTSFVASSRNQLTPIGG